MVLLLTWNVQLPVGKELDCEEMSHKKNRQYFSEPNCHEVIESKTKTSKTLRTSSIDKDSEPKGWK